MILVRDVFQLKFGKARDAKASIKEAQAMDAEMAKARILTDFTGPSYRLILEMEFQNLSEYEAGLHKVMDTEKWHAWYLKFQALVNSSYREILNIVE